MVQSSVTDFADLSSPQTTQPQPSGSGLANLPAELLERIALFAIDPDILWPEKVEFELPIRLVSRSFDAAFTPILFDSCSIEFRSEGGMKTPYSDSHGIKQNTASYGCSRLFARCNKFAVRVRKLRFSGQLYSSGPEMMDDLAHATIGACVEICSNLAHLEINTDQISNAWADVDIRFPTTLSILRLSGSAIEQYLPQVVRSFAKNGLLGQGSTLDCLELRRPDLNTDRESLEPAIEELRNLLSGIQPFSCSIALLEVTDCSLEYLQEVQNYMHIQPKEVVVGLGFTDIDPARQVDLSTAALAHLLALPTFTGYEPVIAIVEEDEHHSDAGMYKDRLLELTGAPKGWSIQVQQ